MPVVLTVSSPTTKDKFIELLSTMTRGEVSVEECFEEIRTLGNSVFILPCLAEIMRLSSVSAEFVQLLIPDESQQPNWRHVSTKPKFHLQKTKVKKRSHNTPLRSSAVQRTAPRVRKFLMQLMIQKWTEEESSRLAEIVTGLQEEGTTLP